LRPEKSAIPELREIGEQMGGGAPGIAPPQQPGEEAGGGPNAELVPYVAA